MSSGKLQSGADTRPDQFSGFTSLVGTTLDSRYRIDEVLGVGGMGAVFLATQLSIGREVAVKVIIPNAEVPQELKDRFWREARMMAGFSHPNIVQLYDFGESDSLVYLVMERVEGMLVSDVLKRGRLDSRIACELLYQLAHALVESHDKGVVHRDLKPGNMLLTLGADSRLNLKVFDFGIAYPKESEVKVTRTGLLCGTPAYMSPEHIRGKEVGPSSDLYSAGVCGFEMLTGRIPFDGQTVQLLFKHVQEPPPSLDEFVGSGEIPPALAELIGELLAKRPEDRVASALEFLKRVEGLRPGPVELEGRVLESALRPFISPRLQPSRASREVRLQAVRRAQDAETEPFRHAADEVKGAWKAFLEHDSSDGMAEHRLVDPNVEHYEYVGSSQEFEPGSSPDSSTEADPNEASNEVDALDRAGELDLSSISSDFPTTSKYKAIDSRLPASEHAPEEASVEPSPPEVDRPASKPVVSGVPDSARSPGSAMRSDELVEAVDLSGSDGVSKVVLALGLIGVLLALSGIFYIFQNVRFAPEADTMSTEELEDYRRQVLEQSAQDDEPTEVERVEPPEEKQRKPKEKARPSKPASEDHVIDLWEDDAPEAESKSPVDIERTR